MENTNRNSNQTTAPAATGRGVLMKSARLINLTPHDITIVDENCRPVIVIPRAGTVARAKQDRRLSEVLIASERLDDVIELFRQLDTLMPGFRHEEFLSKEFNLRPEVLKSLVNLL